MCLLLGLIESSKQHRAHLTTRREADNMDLKQCFLEDLKEGTNSKHPKERWMDGISCINGIPNATKGFLARVN